MKRRLTAWSIGTAFLLISMVLAAGTGYGGKNSIGVGGGLPYGGLGVNYESGNILGLKVEDLTATVGLGYIPRGVYSAFSLRYYLFGRGRWAQMVPSLNLCLGYNPEEGGVDYRLGIGDGFILFINKKISLEGAVVRELRYGFLVYFGLRWHFY